MYGILRDEGGQASTDVIGRILSGRYDGWNVTDAANSASVVLSRMAKMDMVRKVTRKLYRVSHPDCTFEMAEARFRLAEAARLAIAAGFGKTEVRMLVNDAMPPAYAKRHIGDGPSVLIWSVQGAEECPAGTGRTD